MTILHAALLASLLAGEAPAPCTPIDMAQVAHVWHARGSSSTGWYGWREPTATTWAVALSWSELPDYTDGAQYMIQPDDAVRMPWLQERTWASETPGCELEAWR